MNLTDEQKTIQRVVCAACRAGDVFIIGARHFDGMMRRQMDAMGRYNLPGAEQGFMDQFGNFLTRNEAWRVAARQGQIRNLVGSQRAMVDSESIDSYLAQELDSSNLY